jgi:hypothetical protein
LKHAATPVVKAIKTAAKPAKPRVRSRKAH